MLENDYHRDPLAFAEQQASALLVFGRTGIPGRPRFRTGEHFRTF